MRVRNKYLLIMAMVWGPCLALATAAYALVLRPQIERQRQLETRVADAKTLYARALDAAKIETQTRLAEQVRRMEDRIGDFLVGFNEATALAFEIGDLARETRLDSFGMKPVNAQTTGPVTEREHVAEKRLSVNFEGGFPQFACFLNALERHHPVLFVETFTINRPMETDGRPRVDMGVAVLVEKPQGNAI